jgi:hypothetical protein
MARLAKAHEQMTEDEAHFHRVVYYTASALWALGAVEETLAALWDVLQRASGAQGLRAALAERDQNPVE